MVPLLMMVQFDPAMSARIVSASAERMSAPLLFVIEKLGVPLVLLRMVRPVPVWRMLPLLIIVVVPEVALSVMALPEPEMDNAAPDATVPVLPAARVLAVMSVPDETVKSAAYAEPAPSGTVAATIIRARAKARYPRTTVGAWRSPTRASRNVTTVCDGIEIFTFRLSRRTRSKQV